MPRPIFFLHNPKAGGSSLRTLLAGQYPPDLVAPVFGNAPHDHRVNSRLADEHRGYAFYAGHYGYDMFKRLGRDHALITNFREPVERIVSIYRFWRNNVRLDDLTGLDPRDAAIVRAAHDLDFGSFIRNGDESLRLYLNNFHFRQIRRSGWEPLRVLPWDLPIVKGRISRMPWFYIAETPDESLSLLRKAFPELAGRALSSDNPSSGEQISPSSADIDHLMGLNRLDHAIYRHAIEVQRSRLRNA